MFSHFLWWNFFYSLNRTIYIVWLLTSIEKRFSVEMQMFCWKIPWPATAIAEELRHVSCFGWEPQYSGIKVSCLLNPLLLAFSSVMQTIPPSPFLLMPLARDILKWMLSGGSSFVVFSDLSVWDKHPEYKKGAYLYRFRNLELYLTGNKITAHTLWNILGLLSK